MEEKELLVLQKIGTQYDEGDELGFIPQYTAEKGDIVVINDHLCYRVKYVLHQWNDDSWAALMENFMTPMEIGKSQIYRQKWSGDND